MSLSHLINLTYHDDVTFFFGTVTFTKSKDLLALLNAACENCSHKVTFYAIHNHLNLSLHVHLYVIRVTPKHELRLNYCNFA